MDKWRSALVCDVVNLILGVFLLFSPGVFHFAPGAEVGMRGWAGIVIAALSIA